MDDKETIILLSKKDIDKLNKRHPSYLLCLGKKALKKSFKKFLEKRHELS